MKKIIFSLFTIIFMGEYLFAQEINKLDENGKRTGVWRKHYPNKQLRYEGEFINGNEVGVFKFYAMSSSTHPLVIKTFIPDSKEVKVQFFSNSGVVESEGMMIAKKRVGRWVYYHRDGKTLMIEENYNNGLLSGEYKLYYKNLQITKLTHYKGGRQHGNCKQYTTAGILIEDINYVNGQLHGEAVYYETNGNVKQIGQYEEDLRVGIWEFYVDGKLTTSKEIKPLEKEEN